jgi:cell division protein FtsL
VSILARVFVVLNFALAVAFLIFSVTAYSKRVKYYDNWKQEEKAKAAVIAEKDAIIGEKDKKIAEQTATIAERDREKSSRRSAPSCSRARSRRSWP